MFRSFIQRSLNKRTFKLHSVVGNSFENQMKELGRHMGSKLMFTQLV
jgi:hypothetical protein